MRLETPEEILSSLLGKKMAKFLDCCEPNHPDLICGTLRDAFCEALEISEMVRFCVTKGMRHPITRMRSCPRADWPNELFRARFFKEPHRSYLRSRKRPFAVESHPFFRRLSERVADLPFNFSHILESRSKYKEVWESKGRLFRSVGCIHLSSLSEELAGRSLSESMGFVPVSPFLAAMVLFKRAGGSISGRFKGFQSFDLDGKPFSAEFVPLDLSSNATIAPNNAFLSEVAMGGHPFFDHHVSVCARSGKVFLGERDGVFYFVGENYSDCGGEP